MFIDDVKAALRVTSSAYDVEISNLIQASIIDMQIAGVDEPEDVENLSAIIKVAIITYCKMNFGSREDYENLKKSYDEQKAQLKSNSNFHTWSFNK